MALELSSKAKKVILRHLYLVVSSCKYTRAISLILIICLELLEKVLFLTAFELCISIIDVDNPLTSFKFIWKAYQAIVW